MIPTVHGWCVINKLQNYFAKSIRETILKQWNPKSCRTICIIQIQTRKVISVSVQWRDDGVFKKTSVFKRSYYVHHRMYSRDLRCTLCTAYNKIFVTIHFSYIKQKFYRKFSIKIKKFQIYFFFSSSHWLTDTE